MNRSIVFVGKLKLSGLLYNSTRCAIVFAHTTNDVVKKARCACTHDVIQDGAEKADERRKSLLEGPLSTTGDPMTTDCPRLGCVLLTSNAISMISHFISCLSAWLMIQGTRESKILGGGGCFVRFSYFKYVTCCRLALLRSTLGERILILGFLWY